MQTQNLPNKEVRNLLFKRLINDHTPGDNRSEFDKRVGVEEFRDKFFAGDSEYVKNNPAYKLRTEQLRTNKDTILLIRTDLHKHLLAKIPPTSIGPEDNDVHISHFSHYNAIGEDFLVETQMLNVVCNPADRLNIMVMGYGFMYLNDAISGRKLFVGTVHLIKLKGDPVFKVRMTVARAIYETLISKIEPNDKTSFVLGKGFSGLRDSILKNSLKYRLTLQTVNIDTPRGRKTQHSEVIKDLKSVSPSFIDVVQLANLKKLFY